jgi:hypothetical protein
MSTTTNSNSKPIYTAVILDLETAEALQEQLNVPLLSHYANDAHAMQSSSTSTSTASTPVKILNFLMGLCTGVLFSCAGFVVLVHHWHNMDQTDIILFSVIWSSVTSIAAYVLFSLLYIGTCCYFGSNSSCSASLESQQTISILEYCFAVGVFLGFCGACTWTDVAYGMPASSVFLTVVVASLWACLMVYCAMATSGNNSDDEYCEQPAHSRRRRGTVLPLVFV